jgi:hypothetical protein
MGAFEVRAATWITVCDVKDSPLFALLRAGLDKGEAEAIALGVQEQANVILLDERKARRKAVGLDLNVLGTVGILIWAKRAGLIKNLQQQLNTLQTTGLFRLSRTVYEQALQSVGEI